MAKVTTISHQSSSEQAVQSKSEEKNIGIIRHSELFAVEDRNR
jgi:hypothetical protein